MLQQTRILCAALLGGMVVAGIGAASLSPLVEAGGGPAFPPELDAVWPLIAAMPVLSSIVWSVLARRRDPRDEAVVGRVRERLLAAGPDDADAVARTTLAELGRAHLAATIAPAALAEGGALMAAIAMLMQGPTAPLVGVLALAVAVAAAQWPTRRGYDDFIAKRLLAAGLDPEQARRLATRGSPRPGDG